MSKDAQEIHGTPLWQVEPSEASLYRKLFVAVVARAIIDALDFKRSARKEHAEAVAWFQGNSEDFRRTATYAGYDPDWLRGKALASIAERARRAESDHARPAAALRTATHSFAEGAQA